ncbi:hypothetical protein K440DRAFT_644141 [Wilcoxina mikolae CBS 423.85]|nr:hypothetical protein K440DRAFT_644141 [Wilcoxina mikolae CBS 423.85]
MYLPNPWPVVDEYLIFPAKQLHPPINRPRFCQSGGSCGRSARSGTHCGDGKTKPGRKRPTHVFTLPPPLPPLPASRARDGGCQLTNNTNRGAPFGDSVQNGILMRCHIHKTFAQYRFGIS